MAHRIFLNIEIGNPKKAQYTKGVLEGIIEEYNLTITQVMEVRGAISIMDGITKSFDNQRM